MFWGAEGAGASWPGGDGALLAIVPATLLAALALTEGVRRTIVPGDAGGIAPVAPETEARTTVSA